ncbi:N-formylglutamate amidohydrolase [Pseudothauera lacus]|uniref:N-formylglutamate amidohydrolase n=1 Tax=Pseudothauera lacus TaxID=2136175 RepID=A0A2T4IFJ0_9RHOO|nr:N-formylglutamate amidohydrolase [Pseudothauera lacus]PTD96466.1 N-formylglutamate amidohydrolase [Pseudothauera lacus]
MPKPYVFEHRTRADAALLITCEHGGNSIPASYRALFAPYAELLASHRGFDAGALVMARSLAAVLGAPLLATKVSRLLVDLNRSVGHPRLHFGPLLALPALQRQRILARYYWPYRNCAGQLVSETIASCGHVIHLSCHSFTPVLDGKRRTADVGLLYDPARAGEKALCAFWKRTLKVLAPDLSVRRNYPYAGRGDGLTRWLRERHPPERYVGIELELNQKLVRGGVHRWAALREAVIASLETALAPCSRELGRPPLPPFGAHCAAWSRLAPAQGGAA